MVGGKDVDALVAHERGGAGDRVEGPLDLGPDGLLGSAPTRPRRHWMRGAGEVEQVSPFGVVELKRPSREYHEVGGAYVKDGEICGALGIRVTDGSQLDDTLDTAAAHPDRR